MSSHPYEATTADRRGRRGSRRDMPVGNGVSVRVRRRPRLPLRTRLLESLVVIVPVVVVGLCGLAVWVVGPR